MTYTYPQLCALFQLSFTSNAMRKRLVALKQHGFPPPLPGGGGLWSKPAVDHWLATWGNPPSPSPALGAGEGGAHAPDEGDAAHPLQAQLQQIYN